MKKTFRNLVGMFTLILLIVTSTTMAYSTNTDLLNSSSESTIVQLLDDENAGFSTIAEIEAAAADEQHVNHDAAVRSLERLVSAREDADEYINSFLSAHYDVPLAPVPGLVRTLSVNLHKYNLYERRDVIETPDNVRDLEKKATERLKMIQAGTIKIQDTPDVGSGQIVTNKTKSDRMFPDDVLDGY